MTKEGSTSTELEDEGYTQLVRELTRHTEHGELDDEIALRVENLARSLSQATTRDGEHSVPDADIDIHAALTALVRDAKRQNIESRRTGVILDGVTVLGVDTSLSPSMDYGDVLLFPRTIARATFAKKQTRVRRILDDVDILVRPGEMLLVLGRPGAGCSSLLKTVAGVTKQFNAIEGDISYDGIGQEEMLRKYSSEVIYNGEQDVHFPHLTVKQTLDFALACKTPHVRINGISRKEHIQMMRDLYATIFGLRHAYNTKVGNDFVRGVSGGERKRVSIAEALAASGSIYCWDNATRGLDASTALEYAQAIRLMTNLLMSTTLVTIYQASERIYESFDKVTILYEGRQIYFGDVLSAKAYFENLGYECPPRQSTSEFLTSLTDINGYHLIKSGYENRVPRTADEFAACWRQSVEYKNLKEEIIDYKEEVDINATKQQFDRYKSQAKSKYARNQSSYTISFVEQAQLCLKRGLQRIYGDKSFTITNIVAGIIQAVITGTLYHKTPSGTSGAFSRSGVMYVSVLYYSLIGLSSINLSSRPILQKHMNYMLYHPSAEALTSNLAAFPFRLLGMVIFYVILYFLSGLTASAGRFFMGFFFLLLSAEAVNLLFEAVAAMCDTMAQAASICGIIMLAISLYSTYLIQTPSMHPWFKWISYVLPLRYSFEGMLNSEFHNRHLSCDGNYIPVGEGYEGIPDANRVCAFLGSKPGAPYVLGDDYLKANYSYAYAHQWRNVGILLIFIIGFMAIKCIATEFKNPVKGTGDTLVFTKSSFYKHSVKKMDEEAAVEKNEPDSKVLVSSETNKAFEGLRNTDVFIWKQVSFSIPHRGSYLQLLDDITGYCVPGTLTALMGESGAGKTTLLNTLAQRNVGIITGDMLVNGFPINSSFQRRTGYVQQQDIHVKEMTVRESLIFSARLRRQQSVPDAEKVDYVETIINVLGMESYADAFVGDIGSGLSVEQRKKLSIGVELVAKPSLLLFLDEPTSGLDSQSSWAIVQLLKKLARAGQSILCTIHQPSATLFEQFDRLLLLKKGGQTVYFGDIGDHSAVVLDYFQRNGARNCEAHENPAEYILEAIGAGATAEVEQDWSQTWRESPEFIKSNEEVNRMIEDLSQTSKSHSDELESTFATSYWYQFRYVMQRSAAILYRDMDYIVAKQMLFITGGLFIGFTFWDVGSSMKGLQNSMFAAFISVILSAPAINQIQERAIKSKELYDVRESKSNMFHWSLLMITQYLAELPYHLVFSTICFVCMFFTLKAGVSATNTAIYFLNYCLLFQLYYVGLGLFVLYLAPDLGSANIMLGLMLTLLLSFCGVTQPADLLPKFWKFMYYATPYTYFLQNFLGLILHNKKVVCKPSEMSILNPPTGMTCGQYLGPFVNKSSGYINNPDATADCAYCLYKVGDEYLSHVSSKFSYLWRNFGLLWLYVAFNIVAMIFSYWFFFVQTTFKLPSFSILKKKLSRS